MSVLNDEPLPIITSAPEHAHADIHNAIAESESRSRQFTQDSINGIHERLNDLAERLDSAASATAAQAPVVVSTPAPVEHVNEAAAETAQQAESAAEPIVAAEPIAAVVKEEPKAEKSTPKRRGPHRRK